MSRWRSVKYGPGQPSFHHLAFCVGHGTVRVDPDHRTVAVQTGPEVPAVGDRVHRGQRPAIVRSTFNVMRQQRPFAPEGNVLYVRMGAAPVTLMSLRPV